MDQRQLRDVVIEALKEIAPEADLTALDSRVALHDQIELDSVDFLNFMLTLERALGIKIPEADYPRLSSLDGCLDYLAPLAAGASPPATNPNPD